MNMPALIILVLAIPGLALAAPRTFEDLADLVTNLINGGIGVVLILGIVIYFYGIVTGLPKASTGEASNLRKHITWGLIALFVMFSVWGLLALLRNTLFGSGGGYGAIGGGDDEDVTCLTVDCVID
jgi:hypothetical protein